MIQNNKFLKYLILSGVWLALFESPIFGQQEQMFTQFSYNKLWYNPGYAGDFESPEFLAIYRKQMMGIEGAPEAQLISYNSRIFSQKVGFAGAITRTAIGITQTISIDISWSYRIQFRRGILSAGFRPSFRSYSQNWTSDKLFVAQNFDPLIPVEPSSKSVGNLGFGLYFNSLNKWYIGAAVPRLIGNSFNTTLDAKEVIHLNIMGGYRFRPSNKFSFMPQFLARYVKNAPFDAEINFNTILNQKLHAGASYRVGGDTKGLGESVDLMFGIQATEKLFMGFSYDIPLSSFGAQTKGAIELSVRWWTNPPSGGDDAPPPF